MFLLGIVYGLKKLKPKNLNARYIFLFPCGYDGIMTSPAKMDTPTMEYRRFGKTNEMISVLTLGGMRFPKGWTPPRDRLPKDSLDNCIETTRRALELGINHIETAHGYVKS